MKEEQCVGDRMSRGHLAVPVDPGLARLPRWIIAATVADSQRQFPEGNVTV